MAYLTLKISSGSIKEWIGLARVFCTPFQFPFSGYRFRFLLFPQGGFISHASCWFHTWIQNLNQGWKTLVGYIRLEKLIFSSLTKFILSKNGNPWQAGGRSKRWLIIIRFIVTVFQFKINVLVKEQKSISKPRKW